MTISLDTPAQIGAWRLLSAISQLTLELETGHNYYGKVSVYKGIRTNFIDGLPERATKQNKCLAMATFLANLDAKTLEGPVCVHAARVLSETLAANGWQITT